MKIIIPGEPIAKARHRTFLMGVKVCTYDPQAKEKKIFQDLLTHEIRKICSGDDKQKAIECGLIAQGDAFDVELTFAMPFAKTKSQGLQNRFLWGLEVNNQKPDIDNFCKGCLDFCKGILYQDDRQIVTLKSRKIYSKTPRTEINIMPHKKSNLPETADKIIQSISPDAYEELSAIVHDLDCTLVTLRKIGSLEAIKNIEDHDFCLIQVACNISRLAESYGTYLANIKKKYPKFFQEAEKSFEHNHYCPISIKQGKTLC